MTSPAPSRSRMLTSSVIALVAALAGALLTAGMWYRIAPLDLWTYPVATLASIVALIAAALARRDGLRLVKAGEPFPGWMSLLAFLLGGFTLVVTFSTSVGFIASQFS